jgi:hypothetical protein
VSNGFPVQGYRVAIRIDNGDDINVLDPFFNADARYVNVAAHCQENNNRFTNRNADDVLPQESTTNQKCTVNLGVLRAQPYSIADYESIACRVVAYNVRGESPMGYGAGAFMPRLGVVPTEVLNVRTTTLPDARRVAVTWNAPDDNGGSPILGYEVAI